MAFRLKIHRDLRDALSESLPGAVLDLLSEALNERLAVSPTKWSKPASFPFSADHQVFDCEAKHQGRRFLFRVSFRYSQDETSLHVGSIRWTEEPHVDD